MHRRTVLADEYPRESSQQPRHQRIHDQRHDRIQLEHAALRLWIAEQTHERRNQWRRQAVDELGEAGGRIGAQRLQYETNQDQAFDQPEDPVDELRDAVGGYSSPRVWVVGDGFLA